MDWHFLAPHLICGYIPAMAALGLYFIVLRLIGKRESAGRILLSFVFCFYLIGVLTMTGICIRASFSPRIVIIPFVDMIRGPVDTALNVLLFIPMGFFLALLYERFDSIGKVAAAGFLLSLSVELVQMFGFGATDINDLITNVLGSCLGYGVYTVLCRIFPGSWFKQIRAEGVRCFWEPLLFWAGALWIMLGIQIVLFQALFAGGTPGGEMQIWR